MRLTRAYLLVPLIAVVAVVILAAVAVAATKSVGVRKAGTGFRFAPASLSIKPGDTVRWSWNGSAPHNVKGPGFQSRTAARLTFSHKFPRKGSFRVVCTIHQAVGQRMTITVR